ncbi:hypothetical protein [Acinetobacter haemolyticus]|uniref:Uncharacterized protein n=1 Tax=Acinetobacter haemolyticus TaxID=29430 RepID=A0AAW4J1A7_ACIHA|nr:hypothetical protein [Acinetobacter haemolyticus]MBO3656705.1 hypothetical protein [Acinetobacter haemolyticus]
MNQDNSIDPIHYLEMMFGRFLNDVNTEEVKTINFLVFSEIVVAFTTCGVFSDLEQSNRACDMQAKLKEILQI